MALNAKQKIFCEEYVANGYNAQSAYKVAYKCGDSATLKVSPYKLLKQESVKEYIKEIQKDRFEALNISADRIAEKLSDIAFAVKGDETYNTQAQLKALDLLQKQLGLQTQKVDANVSTDIVINIVGDN